PLSHGKDAQPCRTRPGKPHPPRSSWSTFQLRSASLAGAGCCRSLWRPLDQSQIAVPADQMKLGFAPSVKLAAGTGVLDLVAAGDLRIVREIDIADIDVAGFEFGKGAGKGTILDDIVAHPGAGAAPARRAGGARYEADPLHQHAPFLVVVALAA